MKKESCSTRLRHALCIRDMKQSELSVKTGIPKSAISQYLSGAFEPKQGRIEKLSKALQVSEAWLMGFDVPMEVIVEVKQLGEVRQEIAKNLISYRKSKNFTQKELADYLGVNNSAVSNWEKGLNSIDIDTLYRACIFFGVSINDMFGAFANVNIDDTSLKSSEVDLIANYRLLDERGKNIITMLAKAEVEYSQNYSLDTDEREKYIKNNAMPFAAANGDSTNLAEAQELYDNAISEEDTKNDEK